MDMKEHTRKFKEALESFQELERSGSIDPETRRAIEVGEAAMENYLDIKKRTIPRGKTMDELFAGITGGRPGRASNGYVRWFDRHKLAERAIETKDGRPRDDFEGLGVKALLEPGTNLVPMHDNAIVPDMRPKTPLDLFSYDERSEREYSFLRQTVRVNLAAPVAAGEAKPTSTYQLGRVDGRLKVVAHLSEPIDEYLLGDYRNISNFLGNELFYGIELAIIDGALYGDGQGENLDGLAHTTGVQDQEFVTDAFLSTRMALNKIQLQDYEAHGFLMHPTDWAEIETTTLASGQFKLGDAGAPIDAVSRRLWGVPVALSPQVHEGESWLISKDCIQLRGEGGIALTMGTIGDDFQRNQKRARAEGRFNLATLRPSGVVRVALDA